MPNNLSGLDWPALEDAFTLKVLSFLDQRGNLPGLMQRLVYRKTITPLYIQDNLDAYLGNGFGLEPLLTQSAYVRPHNRSEDIDGLYLVGQGTQPGGGTPSVMMSARMTAREIARDLSIDDAIVNGVPRTRVLRNSPACLPGT